MKTDMPGLLSIDADAHLRKLTAHMLPSPALLPVELVRSALKRGAVAIAVEVQAGRIVISDNGSGIGAAEWQAIACLADTGQNSVAREKAMARLLDPAHPGIGLLAVFYPGARSVRIENARQEGKNTMRIAAGRIGLQDTCSLPRGTCITIMRRRGPSAEEKMLLAELCAAAQAEISINGRQLKKKPLLPDALVSLNIAYGENAHPSALAIPARGDVCRIWLLDQGIPWQVTAMAPVQGLIFTAALETDSRPTPPAMETLSEQAAGLYRWLAVNYGQFPESSQSRIEDLLFGRALSGADLDLLSICAPFRLWHSPRRLTLAEVRRQAASGSLLFSDHDSPPNRSSNRERDVLFLTARQKDFLFNHLRLPIVNVNAQREIKRRPRKLRDFCRRKIAGIGRSIALFQTGMPGEESEFCRELEMHWRRKLAAMSAEGAACPLSVVMIEGRGLFPAYRLKNEPGETLRIRRRHPITLRALQKFDQDRENCELAFAALMPGYF
jgi:hypothetical protein